MRYLPLPYSFVASLALIGCAGRPGVDVNAKADVQLSDPLPTEIEPRGGALPVSLGQPISVRSKGW